MRVLVTGSRNWDDPKPISSILRMYPAGTIIAEGGALGADRHARLIAECLGFEVRTYEADWKALDRKAGPIRNQQMLEDFWPDVVHAFPLPGSKGTLDMINRAKKAGIPVHIHDSH